MLASVHFQSSERESHTSFLYKSRVKRSSGPDVDCGAPCRLDPVQSMGVAVVATMAAARGLVAVRGPGERVWVCNNGMGAMVAVSKALPSPAMTKAMTKGPEVHGRPCPQTSGGPAGQIRKLCRPIPACGPYV